MSLVERVTVLKDFNVKAKRLDRLSLTKYVREITDELTQVHGLIKESLDRPCQINLDGRKLQNREVLDVFLYAGLAQTTRIRESEKWQSNPILFGVLQVAFYGVLVELLRYIFWFTTSTRRRLLSSVNLQILPNTR
jgi:hypothetical protein